MRKLRYIRLSLRHRVLIWLIIVLLFLVGLIALALLHLKPILTNLAVARVSNTVNRIVVSAVDEAVTEKEIDYRKLVSFDKDENGHVTALRSNMAETNRLQSEITDMILERLGEVSTSELSVPIGTLTGAALLAGRGPALHVKMQSVGSASAIFRNDFAAAGINQTRHQILLQIDVNMSILLPGFTASTKITNEIAVAETIIVGSVPETYTYFDTASDDIEEYAEDYIMNNG